MISVWGSHVAHLGGDRGDRLFFARDGGRFEVVADLGWDAAAQVSPQRRILLCAQGLFVLEGAKSLLMEPPLRVRRFDPDSGGEVDSVEGPGKEGDAALYFRADRLDEHSMRLVRYGIDPERGVALRWESTQPRRGLVTARKDCYGIPVRAGDAWWYAFRREALLRLGGAGDRLWAGDPYQPALHEGRCVAAGVRGRHFGVWVDGDWTPMGWRRPFPEWRSPLAPIVAPWGGGWTVLTREGGPLLENDGTGPRPLPGGIYGAVVGLEGRWFALEESGPPRLVPLVPP